LRSDSSRQGDQKQKIQDEMKKQPKWQPEAAPAAKSRQPQGENEPDPRSIWYEDVMQRWSTV
jgi:hypothetical protein